MIAGSVHLERRSATEVTIATGSRSIVRWDRSGSYIEGPPIVAIEIRSPSDGPRRLAEAVHDYLAAGTALVWVIDPRARAIHVHLPGMPKLVLGPEVELEGGDVLPGLRLPVAAITDAAR